MRIDNRNANRCVNHGRRKITKRRFIYKESSQNSGWKLANDVEKMSNTRCDVRMMIASSTPENPRIATVRQVRQIAIAKYQQMKERKT